MKPAVRKLTEYEQLVSEAYTADRFFETEKKGREEIEKFNHEIATIKGKRDKTVSGIENEKPSIKVPFDGDKISVTSKDEIDHYAIYKGKKFGKPLEEKEPGNGTTFHNPISGHFWKMVIIFAIIGGVGCFGTFLANEILAMTSKPFLPGNTYHNIWLFDLIGGAVGGALLSMFISLVITLISTFVYMGHNTSAKNVIRQYRGELKKRRKTYKEVYASELKEAYEVFDNSKKNYVEKEVHALTLRQECRTNSIEIYQGEIGKLSSQLAACVADHKNFEKGTVIPYLYISKPEVVKKLLYLLLNKRANNVTDLINLYETEEWRNKLINAISSELQLIHKANATMCSELASINTKTDFMIASINNVSVSIDKMNNSVSSKINQLNSDLCIKLASVEHSIGEVRSAVNSIDVNPQVNVKVDNYIS